MADSNFTSVSPFWAGRRQCPPAVATGGVENIANLNMSSLTEWTGWYDEEMGTEPPWDSGETTPADIQAMTSERLYTMYDELFAQYPERNITRTNWGTGEQGTTIRWYTLPFNGDLRIANN